MLISTGKLTRDSLANQVIVVTGAGGGIGFEAARSLLWLGARVIIAEVDKHRSAEAAQRLAAEFGADHVLFVQTDVGSEEDVQRLARAAQHRFGQVDVVLNNATLAPHGKPVHESSIEDWDSSYRVNLRGPVLLAQAFLPGMVARQHGIFVCVSSKGAAYLGAYESLKAAQVHLAETLDAELENTGVIAFTIGPGLVPTATAQAAVQHIAPLMGLTLDAFYTMNQGAILSVEAAGAGFAAAIALAAQFKGQEISSLQALIAAQLEVSAQPTASHPLSSDERKHALSWCRQVRRTLEEQAQGWQQRSIFERQWMLRDFKKNAGMPVEQWRAALTQLEHQLETSESIDPQDMPPLARLAGFYAHLGELAKGYEKDQAKLAESMTHINRWIEEVKWLQDALKLRPYYRRTTRDDVTTLDDAVDACRR
jgi:NAD(P)-dependent dehydrogenase (short-subunit alcohol dehydrogenase family)